MMRTTVRSFIATLALTLTLPAMATAQTGFSIGVAGGPSIPLGSLSDDADTGFHLRGSLGLQIPFIPIGARADLLWHRFPDQHDGHFNGLAGLLNATWRLTFPIVQPYLVGGAGFMNYDEPDAIHDDHVHPGDSGTEFAWAAGAGVQLRLLRIGTFVEARYLDWGRHRAVPLTIGIMF
jgi:opacity protein-like surface antigen